MNYGSHPSGRRYAGDTPANRSLSIAFDVWSGIPAEHRGGLLFAAEGRDCGYVQREALAKMIGRSSQQSVSTRDAWPWPKQIARSTPDARTLATTRVNRART